MKILGIDYGRKKIGVSIGDTDTKLVEPLATFKNFKFVPSTTGFRCNSIIFNFKSILNDQIIKKIIIGNPGGKIEEEIIEFGDKLQKELNVPIEYFDETLTTQDAQKILFQSGKSRKSRKENEDAVAAAIMLQWYFDSSGY